jgi:hypothetical protein
MGENLCQLYIWQGINNQNTQGAQKLEFSLVLWILDSFIYPHSPTSTKDFFVFQQI